MKQYTIAEYFFLSLNRDKNLKANSLYLTSFENFSGTSKSAGRRSLTLSPFVNTKLRHSLFFIKTFFYKTLLAFAYSLIALTSLVINK